MKLIQKSQALVLNKNSNCEVTDYRLGDPDIDIAHIKITGRYPDKGRVTNTQCKEVVYVQEGSGVVVVEGQTYELKAGDGVFVDAGEKYYWEGHMTIVVACHPTFSMEQHLMVE